MPGLLRETTGWRPDLPDRRDYSPFDEQFQQALKSLPNGRRAAPRADLRKYCGEIDDQLSLNSSSAHAAIALVQYFERRCSGRLIRPSRLFIYRTSRRISAFPADTTVGLRDTFKAIVRFGLPPERAWPYDVRRRDLEPTAFAYASAIKYSTLKYVRLDSVVWTGAETLAIVKGLLAAGMASAFGFCTFDSLSIDADVAFPTLFDSPHGGQSVVAVGYDDTRRIRSDKGALLIRNSWDANWGDNGYGWLPYSYVVERLAVDFWTLFDDQWIASGEFTRPRIERRSGDR